MFLVVTAATVVSGAWEIPLKVREQWGQGGIRQVSGGVPLLPGQAMEPGDLRLITRGADGKSTGVPAQFRPLARWWRQDNSIRWVLVDFTSAIDESQTRTFYLTNDKGENTAPASPLSVKQTDDSIVITTGPAQFTVNRKAFSFLDSVKVDADGDGTFAAGEELLDSRFAGGIVMEDTYGNKYLSSAGVESVEVLESGPVRARVRARGVNRAPAGKGCSKGMYQYDVFLDFYAGSTDVKADIVICNNFTKSIGTPTFEDASLILKLAGGANAFRFYGESRIDGRFVGDESYALIQDSNGAESWRICKGHYGPDTSTFRGYKVLARHKPGFKGDVVREGSFEYLKVAGNADSRSAEDEMIQGARARGVTQIRNDKCGIVMHVPFFWEQFPKGVETSGDGTLRLALFPREYAVPHFFEDTSGKGHTVILHFYSTKMKNAYASEDGHPWPHVIADCWDYPVFPMPPMAHKAACGALTDVGPYTPPVKGFETWPMEIHYRRMLMTDKYWGNGFGWQVFGSRWQAHGGHSMRGARQPIKEDCFLYRYYTTEDRNWWIYGEARSRNFRDVRCYRIDGQDALAFDGWEDFSKNNCSEDWTSRPQPGDDEEYKRYSQGLWNRSAWLFPNPEHCTLDLLYDRYLLFGDQRSLENMRVAAGHGGFYAIANGPNIHRATGWSWRTLERYWELTGDKRAGELLDRIIGAYSPLIGKENLWFQSTGYQHEWFTQVFSRAAAITALHTRNRKAIDICRALAGDKDAKADYFCTLYAVLYHLTGEAKYKDALLKKTSGTGDSLLTVNTSGDFPATAHWLLNTPCSAVSGQ
jgi:hypothetical protein